MKRHLPPLNSLRAFEAAARHESFTKAADELFVTPGAVSRQVHLLEEHLGTALFTRLNREVVITDEGRIYQSSLTKAFDQINMSTQFFKKERSLKIGTHMTVGMSLLIPVIGSFMRLYPKYPITLATTTPSLADVSSGTIDVAIMGGNTDHNWPGLITHRLFPNVVEPVVSPDFLKSNKLDHPRDLSKVQLLHSAARPDDWEFWLNEIGETSVPTHSGTTFETSCMAYQAATYGAGVAIGQRALLLEELKSGALVTPFNMPKMNGTWFYLVYSQKVSDHRPVIAFRDWALEEVEKFNARLNEYIALNES